LFLRCIRDRHEGGIVEDFSEEKLTKLASATLLLSPFDARRVYCTALLQKDLIEGACYSNAGYVLLSHALEVYLATTWEEIVRDTIKMKSLGFGMPKDGLVGHDEEDSPKVGFQDASFHNAPFAVHSTIADWMVFVSMFAKLLRGEESALSNVGVSNATAWKLIEPSEREAKEIHGHELPPGYGAGWRTRFVFVCVFHSLCLCLFCFFLCVCVCVYIF
jgi:CubicO group peptidase (beta-lactamase class C family)